MAFFTEDVKELKMPESLAQASRELRSIKEAIDRSAIVAITDSSGRIIHVNEKFCEISKYSREELIGQDHRLVNSGYHSKEFFRELWGTIASGKVWEGELRNRAKGGELYWVHTTIVPFLDEKGKPIQYISIRYEITQRKLAEEQLRIYAEQLERKNDELNQAVNTVVEREAQILLQDRLASVGLLASSLAHEIGTPLGVIRGRAEYLEMKLGDEPEVKRSATVIISQIDRVSKLIRSLLNLARGNQREQAEPVAPRTICLELQELMAHDFRKSDIRMECLVPEAVRVMAETGPLNQVLLNLMVNSLHAIQTARQQGRTQDHFLRIEAEDRGESWAIRVSDSGSGISSEAKKRLFQPFFTTKDVGKGTGLGLATSYRIVESWGGKIEVWSEPGVGAAFTLVLSKA